MQKSLLFPKNYVNDKKEIVNYLELNVDPFNFGYIVSQSEAKSQKEQGQASYGQPQAQPQPMDIALDESDLPF